MRAGPRRLALTAFAVLASSFAAAGLLPDPASAHALVSKEDLPIPEWLFGWGASIVLIVSFVGLTVLWREPRYERDTWRAFGRGLSRAIVNPVTEALAGLIGVGLLAVTVWTGLDGTSAPDRNFAITFVFVTFWLGIVLLSVLFGDVFRAFNPWRAIARAISAVFARVAGQRAPAPLPYPERFGRWPAVIGLLVFAWFELVWGQSGFNTSGVAPRDLAIATMIYSAITFAAMALFGIEKWVANGETFSVYFRMFSRLAPLDVKDGELGRRRPLSGAPGWAVVPGSLALVMAALGATTFDGAQEGLLKEPIKSLLGTLTDAGLSPLFASRLTNTIFLVLCVLVVSGLFLAGIRGMRTVGEYGSTRELTRKFAHAFIPIVLAYLVAHYFSLFLYQEQAQFTFLLSDPLGDGSNLFGTLGSGINYGLVSATAVWYVQVAALVIGHVTGLVLGHDRALAVYGDVRTATRSQYWMLALMAIFTTLGLLLLSQANG